MPSQVNKRKNVVLIGAAGSGPAFGMVSRIRASWGDDVEIICTDTNDGHLVTTSLLCDRFYKVPPASDAAFFENLISIISKHSVTTYVPVVNQEFALAPRVLSDPRAEGVDVVLPGDPGLEICLDKYAASKWLNEVGLPTPETQLATEFVSTEQYFMKLRDSFGSRGAQIVTGEYLGTQSEDALGDMIIQPVCDGPEVTIDFFSDADAGYYRFVCRERIETKSGVCTKARLFQDENLGRYGAVMAEKLNVRGSFCFQVMKKGSAWLITDINFRPGAGTALSCAAGYDFFSAMFACRWKEPYEHYFRDSGTFDDVFVTRQYAEFVMNA